MKKVIIAVMLLVSVSANSQLRITVNSNGNFAVVKLNATELGTFNMSSFSISSKPEYANDTVNIRMVLKNVGVNIINDVYPVSSIIINGAVSSGYSSLTASLSNTFASSSGGSGATSTSNLQLRGIDSTSSGNATLRNINSVAVTDAIKQDTANARLLRLLTNTPVGGATSVLQQTNIDSLAKINATLTAIKNQDSGLLSRKLVTVSNSFSTQVGNDTTNAVLKRLEQKNFGVSDSNFIKLATQTLKDSSTKACFVSYLQVFKDSITKVINKTGVSDSAYIKLVTTTIKDSSIKSLFINYHNYFVQSRVNDSIQSKERLDSLVNGNNDRRLLLNELVSLNSTTNDIQTNLNAIKDNQTNKTQATQIVDGSGNIVSNFGTVDGATDTKLNEVRDTIHNGNAALNTIATNSTTAATQTLQTAGNNNLVTINGTLGTTNSLIGTTNTNTLNINNKLPAALVGGKLSVTDPTALPLPTGASTSALQTTGNTSLSSIDTKLTNNATTTLQTTGNTSLSSIDTKLTSQATASNQTTLGSQTTKINDGTNTAAVKAASTAPALTDPALVVTMSGNGTMYAPLTASSVPTRMGIVGGQYNATAPTLTTGQTVALQTDANGNLKTVANLGATIYVQSTGNNTSTQLAAATTFTGTIESALSYPQAIISIRCDQAYTVFIDQFSDAAGTIAYTPNISYTRTAGVSFNQAVNIAGSYYRIRITNNGGAATTTLFAETWLGILPTLPQLDNSGNLPVSFNTSSDAAITSTTITALNGDAITGDFSQYKNIKVNLVSAAFVGTYTVQGANEPTFATPTTLMVYSTASGSFISGTSTNTGGVFSIPTNQARYIRIRATAFTSGSLTSTISGSATDINSNTQLLSTQVVKNDFSGTTSATINTATTLMAANSSRYGWSIYNKSNAVIYINETGATATGGNIDRALMPNEYYEPKAVVTGSISIICPTLANAVFECKSWNTPNIANSTLFVQGTTPQGQNTSANSYPVALATNSTVDAQKEWKVVTATGTPTATVGDILLQTIKSNAGTVSVTWFNMTQSTLFTVAPTIANLTENSNKGTDLPNGQNGRQEWSMYTSGLVAASSGSAAGIVNTLTYNISTGTTVTTGVTYTVPAGKTLRVYQIDMLGVYGAITAGYQLGGSVAVIYNTTAPTNTSARAIQVSSVCGYIPTNSTNSNGNTGAGSTTLPTGCDIPSGSVVNLCNFTGGGGSFYASANIVVKGYLYNN
jgi:hypothetical protein